MIKLIKTMRKNNKNKKMIDNKKMKNLKNEKMKIIK